MAAISSRVPLLARAATIGTLLGAAVSVAVLLVLQPGVADASAADSGAPEASDRPAAPVLFRSALEEVRTDVSLALTSPAIAPSALVGATSRHVTEAMTIPQEYCPAPGSQFIDSWGFARSGGRRHKGVDMMAPYGTPVIAPTDGVVRPSNSALGGIGFYLDTADGFTFFGSHLARLDVTGPVQAGQQIGTVGSTGNAGTPHLHFEVMEPGRGSVNPFPYAYRWCIVAELVPLTTGHAVPLS